MPSETSNIPIQSGKSHPAGPKDPVCGMPVEETTEFHSKQNGTQFFFCSSTCKGKFDQDPEKYLAPAKEGAESSSDSNLPASHHSTSTADKSSRETAKIQIPIVNMDCANCAVTIEKQIKQLDGVKKVNVNIATAKAFVEYQPAVTNSQQIVGAIKKAGYKAGQSSLTLKIGGMYCGSCVTKIENDLLKKPGVVSASVDLASEIAMVQYIPAEVNISEITKSIESLGYTIRDGATGEKTEPLKEGVTKDETEIAHEQEYKRLMRKFIFAAVVSVPVVFFSYPNLFVISEMLTSAGMYCTIAVSLARSTLAETTPGFLRRSFSIFVTQEPQYMPPTLSVSEL